MQKPISAAAVRTYRHILSEGGYWSLRELRQAFEISRDSCLGPQLQELLQGGHVKRKGAGRRCDPYRYGVTPQCAPLLNAALVLAA